ncbi:MAG: hypothetical protein K0S47_2854 [Herbinix sp.]|jgi:hypothetical protein|nr:hypothetical protein [Herbinix sp.]
MYIGSTYLYLDFMQPSAKAPASWMTLEKYENCENFYQNMVAKHNKIKLFHRKHETA